MSDQIKNTPDYGTPEAVLAAVELMQQPERIRASNRALINSLMNGRRPYTDEEVAENQIQINVNWGEGSKILQDANRQVNNALLHKGNFVTCTLLAGKTEKRYDRSAKFTANLNRALKRGKSGKKYLYLLKNRNASLVLHGIGVLMWPNNFDWMPKFIPLEDFLIPTGTLQDLTNLTHFAVNLYLTPYELMKMTHGNSEKAKESGWDLEVVRKILSAYGKLNKNNDQYNWVDRPEEMVNIWKQNQVVADSDAVPKVHLIAWYYRSESGGSENEEHWYRKICLKEVASAEGVDKLSISEKFVFDGGKREFASSVDSITSIQYGDCNLVPPQTYHSTRGLGEAIFATIECMNRLRCQWMQHVFENMLMLIRVQNPTDRDRPKVFNLRPYGVVEQGVEIIPQQERHQIDPRLVESAMAESRQLMSESSASFVQDVDSGTSKEQTLGEAQIRLQSANKMVSSMLDMMYALEMFKDEEIVRRFLLPNSDDPDVVEFRKRCKKDEIPDELMVAEFWQVDSDRVLGGGDQALAQQESTALFQNKAAFDQSSQRTIDRMWVSTITRNPALGELLVPNQPPTVTAGTMAADEVFPNLMLGVEVGMREGIERQEYVAKLIEKMSSVIDRISQTDEVGTQQDVIGLGMVSQHIEQNLQFMSQNPENKEFVTAAGKEVGRLMNMVKAFAQRQQEAASQQQQDPEAEAKAQATAQAAQQKQQINEASFEQKFQQREAEFSQKMQIANAGFVADITMLQAKAKAEIEALFKKTEAEIESMKKKAKAAPAQPKAD